MARRTDGREAQPKLKRRSQQRLVLYTATAVAVICLVLAAVLGRVFGMTTDLQRFAIQFLLIVVLGAAVTIVVEFAKRRLDFDVRQREYRIETFSSHLTRLSNLYQAVKEQRRKLKVIDPAEIEYEKYTQLMEDLRDLKQDAEQIWRDMEITKAWIPELDDVRELVEHMEKSFTKVDDEWEFVAKAPTARFNTEKLSALRLFLTESWPDLHCDYYKARKRLIILLSQSWTGRLVEEVTADPPC
jgi:hypothetical protein